MKSQLNLSQKVRAGLGGLSDIASTIALPHEKSPLRLPTYPNLERTSVLPLERTGTIDVGSGTVTFTRAALTRHPGAPLWIDQAITSYGYTTGVIDGTQVSSADDVPFTNLLPMWQGSPYPIASDGFNNWMLVPSTNNDIAYPLRIFTIGTTAVVDVIWGYAGSELRNLLQVPATNVSGQLDVPAGAWFRIASITPGSSSTVQVAVNTPASYTMLLPYQQPAELANSSIPYSDTRCTANACLFTNVGKVLNKEGTVKGARMVCKENVGPWRFFDSTLNDVHPSERYFGALEHGSYSYTAGTIECEKFEHCFGSFGIITSWPTGVTGTTTNGILSLRNSSTFNGLVFDDADNAERNVLAVTHNYHLEFRTASSLFPSGYSLIPLETFHAAQLTLLQTGYFFENELHWSDLARLILQGVRMAAPLVAPNLVGVISAGTAFASAMLPNKPRSSDMSQRSLTQPKSAKHPKRQRKRNRGRPVTQVTKTRRRTRKASKTPRR